MSFRTRFRLLAPSLILSLAAAGCLERAGRPVNPCTQASVGQQIQVENVDRVDVLFMVDNSNSMEEEQATLTREFPTLVNILATGDFNQNGSLEDPVDFPPVRDLNVGVITSDMGSGGFGGIASCSRADVGDDGVLQNSVQQTNAEAPNCYIGGNPRDFPLFLNFQPETAEEGDDVQFAVDFACVATVGLGGCGFEQQLEAVLKAASPANPTTWTRPGYVAPDFLFGTGQADGTNIGFIRDDSVLALVLVTDEEDCSARDQDLFNPSSTTYGSEDVNTRCFAFEEQALHPISRYVDGFLSLRLTPAQLVFAPIVGVPGDLAPPGDLDGPINFSRILNDARMQNRRQDGNPNRLVPSCQQPGVGEAFPPRRFTRVAEELQNAGAGVTIQSICNNTYSDALLAIIGKIRNALGQACLPRPLAVNADGTVDCDVLVDLPLGGDADCNDVMGWNGADPEVGEDRISCRLNQLVPLTEERNARREPSRTAAGEVAEGWFYDDYTQNGQDNCQRASDAFQRIAFTQQPPGGATVRLECLQAVVGGTEGQAVVGDFCTPGTDFCDSGTAPDEMTALECSDVSRTCGVECSTDADCSSAGLTGFVCDLRTKAVANPDDFTAGTAAGDAPVLFCVNPTCS